MNQTGAGSKGIVSVTRVPKASTIRRWGYVKAE